MIDERRDKKWCPETESNHRHCALQAHALPLSYLGFFGEFKISKNIEIYLINTLFRILGRRYFVKKLSAQSARYARLIDKLLLYHFYNRKWAI